MVPKNLHTYSTRTRSKSLGDIDNRRSLIRYSTSFEQRQERTTFSANRSRSACEHVHQKSPHEGLSTFELDKNLPNVDVQKDVSSIHEEVFGEDIENIFKALRPHITKQDKKYDREDGEGVDTWSLNISQGGLQEQAITSWSNNFWSASSNLPSPSATPPIPLPAPNDLTSAYLPFSSHLALTNHFTSSTINNFQTLHTPIFLHSVLQLPSTLAHLLSLSTSDVLCRLSPAILLNHTTTLDTATLLPSLIPATNFSTYHHANGLLYFPQSPEAIEKISNFLAITHNNKTEMSEVQTQIQDSEGKRHEISAWAWVAVSTEGTEEWWTLEDFIAGRIVGLGTVEW